MSESSDELRERLRLSARRIASRTTDERGSTAPPPVARGAGRLGGGPPGADASPSASHRATLPSADVPPGAGIWLRSAWAIIAVAILAAVGARATALLLAGSESPAVREAAGVPREQSPEALIASTRSGAAVESQGTEPSGVALSGSGSSRMDAPGSRSPAVVPESTPSERTAWDGLPAAFTYVIRPGDSPEHLCLRFAESFGPEPYIEEQTCDKLPRPADGTLEIPSGADPLLFLRYGLEPLPGTSPPPPLRLPAPGAVHHQIQSPDALTLELAVAPGGEVHASAEGVVHSVGVDPCCAGGRFLVIDHGDGFRTMYAPLSVVSVAAGDTVVGGSRVGRAVGRRAAVEGVHGALLRFTLTRQQIAILPGDDGGAAMGVREAHTGG